MRLTSLIKLPSMSEVEVKKVMEEYNEEKKGGGRREHRIKSRKQAIAIGLNKARKKGAKVPPPPGRKKK